MTTTSQPNSDDGTAGSEPVEQTPESTKDAQGVPVGEFVEMRQELRATREELEKLKATKEPAQPEPEAAADTQASDGIAEAVKELQQQNKMNTLAAELGLNPKQARAVSDLIDRNPGLNPIEAKSIAASRDPEAFSVEGQASGFDPGIHGMTRPRSVSQDPEPQKSDFKQREEHLSEVFKHNRAEGSRQWNNWVGKFAAEATGRDHDLIPIPKKP